MDREYRNLIRQDFGGTYCLGFLNSHGLDVEEIRTIFSAFGKVSTIKETGDKCGYRFVRYQYADEAEKAIEGLKTHSKIRLVEHRPKNKSENQKNENKVHNGNGNRKENKNKNFNENRNENKCQDGNGYYKKDNQNRNFEEENQSNNGNNKQRDQSSDETYKEESQNDKRTYKENQVQNNRKPKNSCSQEDTSNNLNSMPDNDTVRHNTTEIINMKNNIKRGSLTSSLSEGSLYVEDDYDKLDIPNLVKCEKLKIINNVPKKTILNAEEIIVGNIPNDFGSAFILHLFERYDPIAVSHINFVKNSSTRYCHVYFKTVQHSVEVEKTFDGMNLSGKKLLVLRPSQLIKEAIY